MSFLSKHQRLKTGLIMAVALGGSLEIAAAKPRSPQFIGPSATNRNLNSFGFARRPQGSGNGSSMTDKNSTSLGFAPRPGGWARGAPVGSGGPNVFYENCWWRVSYDGSGRRRSSICLSCPDLPGGECPDD